MTMLRPDHLLSQVSDTLRTRVGPEVGDEFARTQAYMAAVVLQKLAGQLACAEQHAAADRDDRMALRAELHDALGEDAPPAVRAAVEGLASGDGALGVLVGALYDERAGLGPERFGALLARVRITLRARLDRRLEYSA